MDMRPKLLDIHQFPKVFPNLNYSHQSPEQQLDVFLPEDGEGPYPLVVMVHGGGWISGGRRESYISAVFKAVSQGYAMATVDYRLAPGGQWPQQLYDVKAALRYLRANAGSLRLDPRKIVLWGNSAGAYLAQLVAATCRRGELEDLSMGWRGYSCRVDGVISWYGVSDLVNLDRDAEKIGSAGAGSHGRSMEHPACQMLGCVIDEFPGRALAASSITHVGPDCVPMLIQHGTGDVLVPYLQSQRLYRRICECCGETRAVLELFEGAGHGDEAFKTDQNVNRCIDFLDEIFYGGGPRPTPRTPLPEIRTVEESLTRSDCYENTRD